MERSHWSCSVFTTALKLKSATCHNYFAVDLNFMVIAMVSDVPLCLVVVCIHLCPTKHMGFYVV